MAVVRLLKSLCILVPLLLAARPAIAAPARVALVGIFHDTGDSPSALLTEEVTTRLRILGFEFASVPKSAASCRNAECLSPLLREVGADLAMTGIVFRTHELCSASLYVQDLKGAAPRSEDIRCQPDTGDEVLAGEFAEMAGRLTEAQTAELKASSINQSSTYISINSKEKSQINKHTLWKWDQNRKIIETGLGLVFGGLLVGGIVCTADKQMYSISGEELPPSVIDKNHKKSMQSTGFMVSAGISGLVFGVTLAIPAYRR